MNNNTQITKTNDLESLISSPEMQAKFASALPKHLSPDRFARIAILALTRTPKLRECSQESLFKCLLDLSALGLEPDGRNAHLIPFKNNQAQTTECTLIIDYKGYVDLVMRTGEVSYIHADKVCVNDVFIVDCGELKSHVIDYKKERGEVIAYYCIIRQKDGTSKTEVMTLSEAMEIRDKSQGYKSAIQYKKDHPWISHRDEMGKKTVFKRAQKWVRLSPEIRNIIQKEDEHDFLPIRNVTPGVSIPLIEQKPSTENPYKPKDEPKNEVQLTCKSGTQIAIFKELESASGKNAKTGKDWVKYNVKFTDAEGKEGSASTFSESLIAPLEFAQAGEKIEIETEPASNPKYAPTLTGLRMIVESPQPEGEKKDLW